MHYAISATTRSPRPDETSGTSYYFVSVDEYDRLLDRNELLAPAQVHGHAYGVPVDEVVRAFARGKDVLLKVDVQGASRLRGRFAHAAFIFLAPPSFDDLVARLVARHTESPDELERRICDARLEMAELPRYDYVVVNHDGDVEQAARDISCIITAEKLRTHRVPIDIVKG